ncbi:hypothetical protein WG66_007640 [Moniliophthora roreri]|nr:hypothetical protein WG66_007640 [Moniliophthora roreri]
MVVDSGGYYKKERRLAASRVLSQCHNACPIEDQEQATVFSCHEYLFQEGTHKGSSSMHRFSEKKRLTFIPTLKSKVPGPLSFLIPSTFGPDAQLDNPNPVPFRGATYQKTFDQLEMGIRKIEKMYGTSNTPPSSYGTFDDGARFPHSFRSVVQLVDRRLDILGWEESAKDHPELLARPTQPSSLIDSSLESPTQ